MIPISLEQSPIPHFPHLEGKTITGMQLHRASSLVACSKTCRHGLRFGNGGTWGTWGTGTRCKRWLESSEPQRCDWLAQTRLRRLLALFLVFVICLNYRFFMNCLSLCLFVFAKGQAKRFGGMDCMEYVESTSSFVISEDSESLLFVESLNLDVLIHEFRVIGVRKVTESQL